MRDRARAGKRTGASAYKQEQSITKTEAAIIVISVLLLVVVLPRLMYMVIAPMKGWV